MICPVQNEIVKAGKERAKKIAFAKTSKKSISSEAYVDSGKYLKYQPGFCHASMGCTFNHGHIRWFELKWLSYKNNMIKKDSHSEHVLWKNIFVPLKYNPPCGLMMFLSS